MNDQLMSLITALGQPEGPSSDYDLTPDVQLPPGRMLRDAAVLIGIETHTLPEPQVILTRRSSLLQHHPGQIAFPGGKVEDSDADAQAAALREAQEEIGLDPASVEPVCHLSPHETVTGFQVTPVLGLIHRPFQPVPEPGEVEEVFSVPLSHVLNLSRFRVESCRWRGKRRYYYAAPFGPYYIWGATARMLRALAGRASP